MQVCWWYNLLYYLHAFSTSLLGLISLGNMSLPRGKALWDTMFFNSAYFWTAIFYCPLAWSPVLKLCSYRSHDFYTWEGLQWGQKNKWRFLGETWTISIKMCASTTKWGKYCILSNLDLNQIPCIPDIPKVRSDGAESLLLAAETSHTLELSSASSSCSQFFALFIHPDKEMEDFSIVVSWGVM